MSDEPNPVIRRLRTVCRCNNIKHGTIEKAIIAGACSLDLVARATTATTGHCGGTCTPRVLEMLDELVPSAKSERASDPSPDEWWVRK